MDEKAIKDITADDILYIFQHPGCGDERETHTVREWLESFGMSVKDEFFIEWQKVVTELCMIFPNTMMMVWQSVYVGLYLHYDMVADFMPQFKENAKKVLETMHTAFSGKL